MNELSLHVPRELVLAIVAAEGPDFPLAVALEGVWPASHERVCSPALRTCDRCQVRQIVRDWFGHRGISRHNLAGLSVEQSANRVVFPMFWQCARISEAEKHGMRKP
jgi:hypothetical protein